MCLVGFITRVEETAKRIKEKLTALKSSLMLEMSQTKTHERSKRQKAQKTPSGEVNSWLVATLGFVSLGSDLERNRAMKCATSISIEYQSGLWNSYQAVIPHYSSNKGVGSIVIASSVTGDNVADAGEAAYAMTKAAPAGLTKCLTWNKRRPSLSA